MKRRIKTDLQIKEILESTLENINSIVPISLTEFQSIIKQYKDAKILKFVVYHQNNNEIRILDQYSFSNLAEFKNFLLSNLQYLYEIFKLKLNIFPFQLVMKLLGVKQ